MSWRERRRARREARFITYGCEIVYGPYGPEEHWTRHDLRLNPYLAAASPVTAEANNERTAGDDE